jgi:hypothetical protein
MPHQLHQPNTGTSTSTSEKLRHLGVCTVPDLVSGYVAKHCILSMAVATPVIKHPNIVSSAISFLLHFSFPLALPLLFLFLFFLLWVLSSVFIS